MESVIIQSIDIPLNLSDQLPTIQTKAMKRHNYRIVSFHCISYFQINTALSLKNNSQERFYPFKTYAHSFH